MSTSESIKPDHVQNNTLKLEIYAIRGRTEPVNEWNYSINYPGQSVVDLSLPPGTVGRGKNHKMFSDALSSLYIIFIIFYLLRTVKI